MELLKFPEVNSELFKRIATVAEETGWQGEDKELEEILQQNEQSLAEFKKGLPFEKCDFTFGKEYKYPFEKPIPNLLKTRILSSIVVLNGRWHEQNSEFDKAVEEYLSLLTFSQHFSQDNNLVPIMMTLVIARIPYAPIWNYLNSGKQSKNNVLKILKSLSDYKKKRLLLLKYAYESEKGIFISTTQIFIDNDLDTINHLDTLGDEEKDFFKRMFNLEGADETKESFKSEVLKQVNELTDRYYGNLIKATETNNENDWKFAEKEEFILANEVKTFFETERNDLAKISSAENSKYYKEVVLMYIKMLIARILPNLRSAADVYNRFWDDFKKLEELAESKANSFAE